MNNDSREIDAVARSWNVVKNELDFLQVHYEVVMTRPTRSQFVNNEEHLYVVRQQKSADDIYQFVVAAKMGKEVF